MKYEGNLYGRVGNRYIPLRQTSYDVDAMESELAKIEAIVWPNGKPNTYKPSVAVAVRALSELAKKHVK